MIVASFLLLAGLGVVAIATTIVVWIMLEVMAPNALPSLTTVLTIVFGIVALEVVLGTCLAALCTFIYNLSAQHKGGVEVALTTTSPIRPRPPHRSSCNWAGPVSAPVATCESTPRPGSPTP
ncbi:DUF3566 domain-containing protein [Streptomyces sp. NPDC054794]